MNKINDDKLFSYLSLVFSYGVGPATFLKLMNHFHSIEAIMKESAGGLASVVGKGVAESIISRKSTPYAEAALNWKNQNATSRKIICLEDDYYPVELAEIAQPPILFFAEGNCDLLHNPKIAIVGTRHPTSQGMENARGFAHELALNGMTVVSGLAAGIDRSAHLGALEAKLSSTIGVIGTGMDIIYPSSNRDLYRQMATEGGLILSEYQLGTPANNSNFPRRNRIIAGLSKACLVIESAIDGGSMISANFALEMGREVMAIPGSIHNPMARGCHKLIRSGAKLCETAADILEELQLTSNNPSNEPEAQTQDPVLNALGYDPETIDNLCTKLSLDFTDLCGKLLELELSGLVVNCGGGRYQRTFR